MKGYLAKLRPAERRIVVGVIVGLFALINGIFVFPHFSDWADEGARLEKARKKLADYKAEVAKKPELEKKVKKLEGAGQAVPPEDQMFYFRDAIIAQGGQSHVNIVNQNRPSTSTNLFFVEQSMQIRVLSDETNLVNFLHQIGAGPSGMRARGLSIAPDQPRMNLSADVTLVASYQKGTPKPASRSGTGGMTTAKGP
ncbi:MAG: hypothetical protein C5B50_18545 [Verrucomicrobia bacterium]|nr:MAG: hypothetical protein C5B50_18545 [Verrucomicrobiota bacterium]